MCFSSLIMKEDKIYTAFYKKYFSAVYRHVLARIGSRQETEDIVQTIFLKIYLRFRDDNFKQKLTASYLFAAVRHSLVDYFKKHHKELPVEVIGKMPSRERLSAEVFENLDKERRLKLIVSVLNKLSYEQREVIIMRFISGLETREIAGILNKTQDNIRQIQCRAIKTLRNILTKAKYL